MLLSSDWMKRSLKRINFSEENRNQGWEELKTLLWCNCDESGRFFHCVHTTTFKKKEMKIHKFEDTRNSEIHQEEGGISIKFSYFLLEFNQERKLWIPFIQLWLIFTQNYVKYHSWNTEIRLYTDREKKRYRFYLLFAQNYSKFRKIQWNYSKGKPRLQINIFAREKTKKK